MLRRPTQIVLGVFAVLLIVLLVLRGRSGDEETPPADLPTQPAVSLLFDFAPEDVAAVRIANIDGQAVEFRHEGEVWLLVRPPAPAEETDITRISGLVAQFTALRLVTETSLDAPLSALGLQFPPYRLTVTLVDGTVHNLAIGDPSVTNTGYYVTLDGGVPRLVTKSVLDGFIGLLESPPLLPTPFPEAPEPESTE